MTCCCDVSCGFTDEDFSSSGWSDPDEMISGGSVQGTLDTENSRVSREILFPDGDSYRISIRVNVSDGATGWAGMEITDAGGYNTDLIIDATPIGSSDVIVRGRGTVPKTTNGEYLLTIEYVIGTLANPIINYYVDGDLIDTSVAGGKSESGTLRLTAYVSARVMSIAIECPPIGGLTGCDLWCPVGADINAITFPGAVDLAEYDFDFKLGTINGVNKFSKTTAETPDGIPGGPEYCQWGTDISTDQGGPGIGRTGIYVSFRITNETSASVLRDQAVSMPDGLKLLALMLYIYPKDIESDYFQAAHYWSVIDSTLPYDNIDCQSLNPTEIALQAETGVLVNRFNGQVSEEGYSGSFTASPTATILFQP